MIRRTFLALPALTLLPKTVQAKPKYRKAVILVYKAPHEILLLLPDREHTADHYKTDHDGTKQIVVTRNGTLVRHVLVYTDGSWRAFNPAGEPKHYPLHVLAGTKTQDTHDEMVRHNALPHGTWTHTWGNSSLKLEANV